MRRMFIDQSFGGVSDEEFRDDQQANVLFAIKRLLKDMATIAIGGQFDYAAPVGEAIYHKF